MAPQASHKLELTPKQLETVARAKRKNESTKVDEEWLFAAEFGHYFGWQAVKDLMDDNNLSLDMANKLVAGARKVRMGHLYDESRAMFYASVSAQSKNPGTTFTRLTKDMLKQAKADT